MEFCQRLAQAKAVVIMQDGWDAEDRPVMAVRRAVRAGASKRGGNSHWRVEFDKELSGDSGARGCYVLGYSMDGRGNAEALIRHVEAMDWLSMAEKAKIVAASVTRMTEAAGSVNAQKHSDI